MIKVFDKAARVLFFPKRWANSVTLWIQNVRSPDDSIKVTNTCSPREGNSLGLSVNMQKIYDGVTKYFDTNWVTPKRLREVLDESVDGNSLVVNEGVFAVSADWVASLKVDTGAYKINGQSGSPAPADESTMPDNSSTKPGGEEYDVLPETSKWDIGDTVNVTEDGKTVAKKCGVKFRVYTRMKWDEDNYVRYLYFRELTFGKDGKLTAVSEEKGLTQIDA